MASCSAGRAASAEAHSPHQQHCSRLSQQMRLHLLSQLRGAASQLTSQQQLQRRLQLQMQPQRQAAMTHLLEILAPVSRLAGPALMHSPCRTARSSSSHRPAHL